jgi:hypothetical protein
MGGTGVYSPKFPEDGRREYINTARSLLSAASAYHLWEKMIQFPTHIYRDRDNDVIGASHISPTDSVIGKKI